MTENKIKELINSYEQEIKILGVEIAKLQIGSTREVQLYERRICLRQFIKNLQNLLKQ